MPMPQGLKLDRA